MIVALFRHSWALYRHLRDGLAERTVRILPHVTPSPRVPAASMLRGLVSFLFAPHWRNGLAERTVSILPHVTPSPRVPAANWLCGSVSPWTHGVLFPRFLGSGLAVRTCSILPHVTPSPRVPAASTRAQSAFPSTYSYCRDGGFRRNAGPATRWPTQRRVRYKPMSATSLRQRVCGVYG